MPLYFLLVVKMTADKVLPELSSFNATVLQTSYLTKTEAKLREVFGAEEIEA